MQQVLISLVIEVDDGYDDDAVSKSKVIYDDFIDHLKDNDILQGCDLNADPGYHRFPAGDQVITIVGKLMPVDPESYPTTDQEQLAVGERLEDALEAVFDEDWPIECKVFEEPVISQEEINFHKEKRRTINR